VDTLAGQIGLGILLAGCAGLRAFVPLLVAGLAARFDVLPLAARFDWLASDAALVIFGAALVVEVLGDKIPVVDHGLDLLGTLVKPAAATLLAAGVLRDLGPLASTAIGLIAGGGTAATVHVAKAKLRLASTVTTLGLANPFLSLFEDFVALASAVAAVLVPLLVLSAVLAALAIAAIVTLASARSSARAP
jgi:Domain of unknown function (DUF4126)